MRHGALPWAPPRPSTNVCGVANHPDDARRSLGAEEDWFAAEEDWFADTAHEPAESDELVWQDEPTAVRRATPSDREQRRRQAAAVIVVAVAVALVVAGILIARAIGGSDSASAPPATIPIFPTTPAATTPADTGPTTTEPSAPTPSTLTVPTDVVLRRGDTGEGITALQKALAELGYAPGDADGNFGSATEQAVLAFQQAERLTEDGVAGEETLTAVNASLASG